MFKATLLKSRRPILFSGYTGFSQAYEKIQNIQKLIKHAYREIQKASI